MTERTDNDLHDFEPEEGEKTWMGLEGLDSSDIDRLNGLVDKGYDAKDVSAWAAAGGGYAAVSSDDVTDELDAWLLGAPGTFTVEVMRTVTVQVNVEAGSAEEAAEKVNQADFVLPAREEWEPIEGWEYVVTRDGTELYRTEV